MSSRLAVIAVGLFAAACASAPINKTATLDLAKADALVAQGCFDCLTEARDIYTKVAVGKARPLVIQRLFETTVLIGLRQKELAIDPAASFDAAKALIPELPPAYTGQAYLDLAAMIPADPRGGLPRRDLSAALGKFRPQSYTDALNSLAAGPGSEQFRRYLSASLECTAGGTGVGTRLSLPGQGPAPTPRVSAPGMTLTPTDAGTSKALPDDTALVSFRRANCTRIDRDALVATAAEPRFAEAGVFVGRVRSTRPGAKEIADARAWLTAAEAKWPASTSVLYALGALNQTIGDCKAAVTFYDRTIALQPRHEDAHLGRLMCLSYLRQHPAAIAEATGMIADHVEEGEARYWRAWNKWQTNDLVAARQDSDRMKQLVYNDRALTLAGQIEHDQSDLDVADKDLSDAIRISHHENCTAAWYWALVQLKRLAWTPTAEGFVQARDCYEAAAVKDRDAMEEMRKAENVDETYRAQQLANFAAVLQEDESQISASAFNAAVNYARAQNREKALQYLDLAAKDPARAAQVEELRKLIVKTGLD